MRYYKMEEFKCRCCSRVAYPENIETLVNNVLDPAREKLGMPIMVNSGYRCPKHNAEVGGVQRSQHLTGEAADVSAGSTQANERLAKIIEENGRYDQLIRYLDARGNIRFIHVSWKRNGPNRKMKFNK